MTSSTQTVMEVGFIRSGHAEATREYRSSAQFFANRCMVQQIWCLTASRDRQVRIPLMSLDACLRFSSSIRAFQGFRRTLKRAPIVVKAAS
jgi:hypothetical protein